MPIEAYATQNCAIARSLSFLGERWALLILRELFFGRARFDEIQRQLGVAPNMLSARLTTLVEEGIVERRPYSSHPGRFEYRLTEKGRELQPVLLELLAWGTRHVVDEPPLEVVHTECDHVMHPVETCSHCGGELTTRNVRPQPGPGANAGRRPALPS
jgi:DNA-binding HxlR family transcriptional regulator